MALSLVSVCARLLRGCDRGRLGLGLAQGQGWWRGVSYTPALRCEAEEGEGESEGEEDKYKGIDPSKLRIEGIPVETSIKYLKSEAYQTTYGSEPVWVKYRRNFKGSRPPPKTRKTCIRSNIISTGNPCPICRDEYLVLDPVNTDLLKQFISPHNNAILPAIQTNLCRKRQTELEVAIMKARDIGLLTFDVPFRRYHYPDYYPPSMMQDMAPHNNNVTTTTTTATATSSTSNASTNTSPPSSS